MRVGAHLQARVGDEVDRPAEAWAPTLIPGPLRAALGKLPIGTEGANDLGRLASPILSVDSEVTWTERGSVQAPLHSSQR